MASRRATDASQDSVSDFGSKSFVERDSRGHSRRSSQSKISSADFVITVSPGRTTEGVLPYLPPPALQQALQADADVEAGPQQQYTTDLRPPSPVPNGFSYSAGTNGTSELLQPLLSPEPAQLSALPEPGVGPPAGFDPFPATTAARAKAATVARMRALAAGSTDHLRAAMLGRSAATAVTSVAGKSAAEARFQRQLTFASSLSWAVNILLLVAKLYAYWLSQSKAVLASAADSAVDLVSQMVIAYADWKMRMEDPRFPVGQARLEAIGVLACACIMSVASFEVIQESVSVLLEAYWTGQLPRLQLGLVMYLVLGSATLLKCVCWAVCAALQARSDLMLALAEDHLNDIMSNTCAIITAVAAGFVPNGWWIDPAGAIAISLYIVARWLAIAKQQVDKIVGRGADPEFVKQLELLANSHHRDMGLDVIRAYHFGARYIVEMEVVLPAEMSVQQSHDISLELQHKVEQLEEVERAFVHVDYMRRDGLEHKVERELAIARALSTSSSGRITPGLDGAGGSGPLASKDGGPLGSREST